MKKIEINFSNFWPGFNPGDNYFTRLLKGRYLIEISDTPEYLIYSVFGQDYRRYKCIRIFYTGEPIHPDFHECDYSFSFDYLDNPHNYRLPLYGININNPERLIKQPFDPYQILKQKTKFCNFVVSNRHNYLRNSFFRKLSKYKHIDSGGRYMNNLGGPVKDKLEFIKDYKFTFAFEGKSFVGYTTEKIVQPMLVNSIPIYWGNKLIHNDFNTKSFLNYYDYSSEKEFIDRIIEVDQNDDLYVQYLKEPFYHNNQPNEFIKPENMLKQFEIIFESGKKPVALEKKSRFFLSDGGCRPFGS